MKKHDFSHYELIKLFPISKFECACILKKHIEYVTSQLPQWQTAPKHLSPVGHGGGKGTLLQNWQGGRNGSSFGVASCPSYNAESRPHRMIPSGELAYHTLGKGKSSSKRQPGGEKIMKLPPTRGPLKLKENKLLIRTPNKKWHHLCSLTHSSENDPNCVRSIRIRMLIATGLCFLFCPLTHAPRKKHCLLFVWHVPQNNLVNGDRPSQDEWESYKKWYVLLKFIQLKNHEKAVSMALISLIHLWIYFTCNQCNQAQPPACMDAVEGEFANMSALDVVGENPPIWEGGPTSQLSKLIWEHMYEKKNAVFLQKNAVGGFFQFFFALILGYNK